MFTRKVRVAMVSRTIAGVLDITRIGIGITVAGQLFTVVGIFDEVNHIPESLLAVVIPSSVAELLDTGQAEREVIVETMPGAAQQVAAQAPVALLPEEPESLRAIAPPDPRTLRMEVEASVTRSSLLLSVMSLLVGTISIGNAAMSAVAARTGEIGLRRALGARTSHVFAQLVAETTALGAVGGFAGASVGLLITSIVSLVQGWSPVIDLRLAAVAVAACAVAGLAAGLWPAVRATRVTPVAALQR